MLLDYCTFKVYIICTMNNTISISDLRQNTAAAIKSVISNKQPSIIFQRSKPKAVLVDYHYFQDLEEAVQDLSDAKEAEIAKSEPKDSFDKYISKRWGKKPA
jgi:prevent-host-death family protein